MGKVFKAKSKIRSLRHLILYGVKSLFYPKSESNLYSNNEISVPSPNFVTRGIETVVMEIVSCKFY
jgi:hypothetical protein